MKNYYLSMIKVRHLMQNVDYRTFGIDERLLATHIKQYEAKHKIQALMDKQLETF